MKKCAYHDLLVDKRQTNRKYKKNKNASANHQRRLKLMLVVVTDFKPEMCIPDDRRPYNAEFEVICTRGFKTHYL